MTAREVLKKLNKDGWVKVKQNGSHRQFRHSNKKGKVTVPMHSGDIPIGTLKSIYSQAGWDWDR